MVDVIITKLLSKLLTFRLVENGDSLDNTGGGGVLGDCENVFVEVVVADDVVTVVAEAVARSACCSACWSSVVVVVPSGLG